MNVALDRMRPALREIVDSELQPGERVVWWQEARAWGVLRETWALLAFGVVWTAACAGLGFLGRGATTLVLFGGAGVMLGLALSLTPLLAAARARNGGYVLTNRRAIVVSTSAWSAARTIESMGLRSIASARRVERGGRVGDIVLDARTYAAPGGEPRYREISFWEVDDVREVSRLIAELAGGSEDGYR